jgi:photosystem II stability/assembly factor-like uncharacterized protein
VRNRLSSVLVWAAVSLCFARPSLANGRFPYAQRVVEHPNDPNQLVLASTYGLVATRDRGASWYFICEASFAHSPGYLGDPLLDYTADENLLVGVQSSMSLSVDQGCDWVSTLAKGDSIVDHALARSAPGRVVAAVMVTTEGGVRHELYESLDNGRTWMPIGSPIPLGTLYSIDVDPTNAEHFYASGVDNGAGLLATSVDHGATWIVHPIPNTGPDAAPYIAGIHPRDGERIFLRTDNTLEIATRGNALLYSEDGGSTFRELHRSYARLLGFALSPDGSNVLIGYGDPGYAGARYVPGPLGVFMSPTDRFSFEQVHGGHVNCLAWTKTGVYVCSAEAQDGYELAFSPVADFRQDGGCLVPLLHLREVKGPLACQEGTTSAVCVSEWPTSCFRLGACSSTVPKPRDCIAFQAPPDPFAAGTGSGAGGSSVDAGGGAAGTGGAAAASGGCGCRTVRGRERHLASMSLCFLLALLGRRRRFRARCAAPSACRGGAIATRCNRLASNRAQSSSDAGRSSLSP